MTAVRQRTTADCGVTALAILATDIAMRKVDPGMLGLASLHSWELIKAGRAWRPIRLSPERRFNLDTDNGILKIRWNDPVDIANSPDGHFVTVLRGQIHCPLKHVVMPWRDYLATFNARKCTLLREAE